MGTGLSRIEPQTFAANWKTLSACWPRVVPGLPPTGATGVGSLKPTPGPLTLTMMMLAAPKAGALTASRRPARRNRERSLPVTFMGYFSSRAAVAGWALPRLAPSTQAWLSEPSGLIWASQTFRYSGLNSADIVPSAKVTTCGSLDMVAALVIIGVRALSASASAAVGWRILPVAGSMATIMPLGGAWTPGAAGAL